MLCAPVCGCVCVFVASHPHYVTVTVPLLWCEACKWVMGSVRRWQTRWGCEVCYRDRESPADTSYPASYLKAASLRQDLSGPGSTTFRTRAAAFDHLSDDQRTLSPIPFMCYVMLWSSLCGTEDTGQSTGCLLKAQSDMSVTGSGRTLRIRSMAGTPIIQLCNRLFSPVSPALLLFMLTCCAFPHFLLIVLLSIAIYSVYNVACNHCWE